MSSFATRIREKLETLELHGGGACVVEEIAGHLEELRDEFLRLGMGEASAAQAAWNAFNWDDVRAELEKLQREESFMERVQRLWLPALGGSIAFVLLLFVLGKVMVTWYWHGMLFFVNWLYVLALLPVGSAVAYWAKEKGASAVERVEAAILPALVWTGVLLLTAASAAIFDGLLRSPAKLAGFALILTTWGVLPGVALLTGALLFARVTPGDVTASH